MREEILRMERVTYLEQGVPVLDGLNLNIFAGEIFGLVPANGFGVAAMTQILLQNLPLHYGYIYYKEHLINTWRGHSPRLNRIHLIQNQTSLADSLTVSDNIFVLRPGFRKYLISRSVLRRQIVPFLEEVGVEIPPDAYADDLTVFQRVVVELLKAMVAGCALTILWDVSTFVSEQELERLHRILRRCAEKGMSFLYICPHMEEAEALCDRTALMLNGQILKIFSCDQKSPPVLPLVGNRDYARQVREQIASHLFMGSGQIPAFAAENVVLGRAEPLSFQVARGECLVIQDLNNQLFSHPFGNLDLKRPRKGRILIDGQPLTCDRDIAVVQELAASSMLFPEMSYLDNLCFTLDHRMPGVWLSGRIRRSLRQDLGLTLGDEVFDLPVSALTKSQKYDLVYTRILLQRPKVVFCVQPFKGAEMAERMHISELLERFMDKGIAVVILAVNLADSLTLANRVLRLQKGQPPEEFVRAEFQNLPESTPWRTMYKDLAESEKT